MFKILEKLFILKDKVEVKKEVKKEEVKNDLMSKLERFFKTKDPYDKYNYLYMNTYNYRHYGYRYYLNYEVKIDNNLTDDEFKLTERDLNDYEVYNLHYDNTLFFLYGYDVELTEEDIYFLKLEYILDIEYKDREEEGKVFVLYMDKINKLNEYIKNIPLENINELKK